MSPLARAAGDGRIPVLYLAPWVDQGGSDTGTIDWFRWIDRDRFAPSLVTTQPSSNRRLEEIRPFAEEVWSLPDLMHGLEFPGFILDFIHSRGIQVVHIMNSRIGFELLSDIRRVPDPPAVVVQLHVEEPDRSGYVRYVTTRYGNLVDAFSITSHQLAQAVIGYGVPASKCRVIYTGVDAQTTFAPSRVTPVADLGAGPTHVLFPGRLVEQKDPLLMVDVARTLAGQDVDVRIHSVGDGHLEDAVRAEIKRHGLEERVLLHGASWDMAPWYAATHAVLMTSVFEGVPYVVYEAMAMGLPVVAPDLPGNVELLGTEYPLLVSPRDRVEGYTDALRRIHADAAERSQLGAGLRRRAIESFSLVRMGAEHGRLYLDLLAHRRGGGGTPAHPPGPTARPERVALRSRPPYGDPLVSVIVPCYNHGIHLGECLASIAAQTYRNLEVIVVDDGSTDPLTADAMRHAETEPGVRVLRLERNRGPGAARNAALELARGRFVLPVDADNLLLPHAVESMVRQLQAAGEQIGFVYPNQQFFGNRVDYWEAPAYNLHTLLRMNYCDTSALIDVDVFAAGLRYLDGTALVHEDWDFVLQMAGRGIFGEPASQRTLLTRTVGFSRSNLVERAADASAMMMRQRHRALVDAEPTIKARWSPALSVVLLDPAPTLPEARRTLLGALRDQTCGDVEVILHDTAGWPPFDSGLRVRRVPLDLWTGRASAAATGLQMARGRYICVHAGDGLGLFGDRAFVEKLLRSLVSDPATVVFVDLTDHQVPPFARLARADYTATPVALAWCVDSVRQMGEVAVDDDVLPTLLSAFGRIVPVAWRHLPVGSTALAAGPGRAVLRIAAVPEIPSLRGERSIRLASPPLLPSLPRDRAPSWFVNGGWRPPLTAALRRHVNPVTGTRSITGPSVSPPAPPGFVLERELGSIQLFPMQGTTPLIEGPGPTYRLGAETGPVGDEMLLGHLERYALPLLDPVFVARHRVTGQEVLVSGEDDPLLGEVTDIRHLGMIEPFPIRPRGVWPSEVNHALAAVTARSQEIESLRCALEDAEQLRGRLARIEASLPARVYRRVRRVPGVRSVLLGLGAHRRPNRMSERPRP